LSLIFRLLEAGIHQGSAYHRNVLIQPGPLTAQPSLRSMSTPSFRVIDFGRVEFKNSVPLSEWTYCFNWCAEHFERIVYGCEDVKYIDLGDRDDRRRLSFSTTRSIRYRPYWRFHMKHLQHKSFQIGALPMDLTRSATYFDDLSSGQ
jgi:hypothetical protein